MCFVSFVQNYLFFCSGEEIHVTTHKVSTKTRHFYSHTQPHSFGDCSLQKSAKNSTYSHNKLRLFQVFFSFFLEIPWLGRGYTSFLSTEFPMTEYGSTRKKTQKIQKWLISKQKSMNCRSHEYSHGYAVDELLERSEREYTRLTCCTVFSQLN